MKLIFATHNEHKLKEVKQLLSTTPFEIQGLSEIGYHTEIIEDGITMAENASIKSRTVHKALNAHVFSDDSGLEIEALDMRPGVHTARFAGPQKDAHDNMDKVLRLLQNERNRKARFKAVFSLIIENKEHSFEGIVNGSIAEEKQGLDGFGYDPIFIPEGYTDTFAQLPASVKNEISHRANAVRQLCKFLETYK